MHHHRAKEVLRFISKKNFTDLRKCSDLQVKKHHKPKEVLRFTSKKLHRPKEVLRFASKKTSQT
jgi:hypothetical protein